MPVELFTDEIIKALIFLIIALTFLMLTTRVKLVGIISIVPCIALALEFGSSANPQHTWETTLIALTFVALAVFNGWYSLFGGN